MLACAVAYACARARWTHEYSAVPWRRLLALEAPLPFGHRVLIPWLSRPIVEAGVDPGVVFGVVEAISFAVVLGATAATLQRWVSRTRARLGALLLGVALVFVYIVPRTWPLQYPWDGPAIAVLALGWWALLHEHYRLALVLTAIGAANRETAVLLPAIALVLALDGGPDRGRILGWAQLMLAAAIAMRVGVAMLLPENPGPALHWTIGRGEYRVLSNLRWVAKARHWPWLLLYLGVLPLAWPLVAPKIPAGLRRVARLGVVLWLASMLVANVYEPRAWGEAVYLMSVGTLVGLLSPKGNQGGGPSELLWLRRVDRWALPLALVGFVAFVLAMRAWAFVPIAQWPMPP